MRDRSSSLGPIFLQPGVRRSHLLAFFVGAFTTLGLLTSMAVTTPYVLTVSLHVPPGRQGVLSGDLHVWQELATLVAFGPLGVLADRIGRRQVYAAGLLLMAAGYALYSYAASVSELVAFRLVYATGVAGATAMLATVAADYPQDRSRGVTVALTGVLNGLGIIGTTVIVRRLPEFFAARGADAATAGHYTHFAIAGACVATALVLAFGLRPGLPVQLAARPRYAELVHRALREAANPRVALAYACGFVLRAQMAIIGTFTILWGTTAALARGMDLSVALAKGSLAFVIPSTAGLLWQLCVLTWLLDRVNRVTGVVACTALGAAGYAGTLLIADPLAPAAIPLLVLLGIGQISTFTAGTTLISHEAPAEARGSVIGMFNICGSVGILFATFVGGRAFDAYRPAAPFALIGLLTAGVCLLAVRCRLRAPVPSPHAATPSGTP